MPDSPYTSRSSVLLAVATGLFLVSAGGVLLSAQATVPGRTVWDAVYTDAQAARGSQVFGQSCNNCHTLSEQGNRPLSGPKFWEGWTQRTVGALLTFVSTNMPNGNGGSLAVPVYSDLVALILKSNGFPAGTIDLAAEAVANVQIIPKDGPGELPANTLARIVGCLARNGRDWALTNASVPERIEKTGAVPEDATRALGDRTIALKFVLTRLDAFIGQRVAATGILLGAGGADGLNVSTVNRVGETCP